MINEVKLKKLNAFIKPMNNFVFEENVKTFVNTNLQNMSCKEIQKLITKVIKSDIEYSYNKLTTIRVGETAPEYLACFVTSPEEVIINKDFVNLPFYNSIILSACFHELKHSMQFNNVLTIYNNKKLSDYDKLIASSFLIDDKDYYFSKLEELDARLYQVDKCMQLFNCGSMSTVNDAIFILDVISQILQGLNAKKYTELGIDIKQKYKFNTDKLFNEYIKSQPFYNHNKEFNFTNQPYTQHFDNHYKININLKNAEQELQQKLNQTEIYADSLIYALTKEHELDKHIKISNKGVGLWLDCDNPLLTTADKVMLITRIEELRNGEMKNSYSVIEKIIHNQLKEKNKQKIQHKNKIEIEMQKEI